MEKPPPVPPKDWGYNALVESENHSSAPTSASKRKRGSGDEVISEVVDNRTDQKDTDVHTPKRSRSRHHPTDSEASVELSPVNKRSVRRKKGTSNLSNLNLRHAMERDKQDDTRESKFQEGSLTDKPSEKPPSIFTRMIRTDSGNLVRVDDLMHEYHNEPRAFSDITLAHDDNGRQPRSAGNGDEFSEKKEESGGFFRFGRQLASSFHPMSLWNRVWHDSKEESTRQDTEEERKAKLKADAEAKYAHMKQNGQLGLQPVGPLADISRTHGGENSTPRDSGIDLIDTTQVSNENYRAGSALLQLTSPNDDAIGPSGNDIPSVSKLNKTLRSRISFKRPSLINIKEGLKRMSSDINLGASATTGTRESSSSLSPVKTDFEDSTLRRSHSKFDLKKQQKLTKCVSDLEFKLQQARKELDDALVEASPMPNLGSGYDRFTPSGTIKRPRKFVPGNLPSLPSERLLMAEQTKHNNIDEDGMEEEVGQEAKSRSALEFTDRVGFDHADEETIKARDHRVPTHVASLFNLGNHNIEIQPMRIDARGGDSGLETGNPMIEGTEIVDPTHLPHGIPHLDREPAEESKYAPIDAKIISGEETVKASKNSLKPKKRKSGVADQDKNFRPETGLDDDVEWEEAEQTVPKKKKRKPTSGKKQNGAQSKNDSHVGSSQHGHQSADKKTSNGFKSSPPKKKGSKKSMTSEVSRMAEEKAIEEYSADEQNPPTSRSSLDSQGLPLEPVMEEDEELHIHTLRVPINDVPSKPSAKATPARHSRGLRPRSASPNKRSHSRSPSVQPEAEEQIITRAADAAQNHLGRRSRSHSPPPKRELRELDGVTILLGAKGVPELPKGVNQGFHGLSESEGDTIQVRNSKTTRKGTMGANGDEFQWPDDVF